MKYHDFFQAFYIGEKDGHIKGIYTTCDIPRFFAELILHEDSMRDNLPTDGSSYDKWFHGTSSPRNHWNNFRKEYNEDRFVSALIDNIEERNLGGLLANFGIVLTEGESINKELFFRAIAQQFELLIDGKGTAENIVPTIYASGNIKADFTDYIDKAKARYDAMKLIGGEEVKLTDFFVCNTIGEKERVFADKSRLKCAYLDDPDLDAIRQIFKAKHHDNLKTILVGSGGCGKSLMLQSLFLKAADAYATTGILPIFVELRQYKNSDALLDFIVNTVKSKDSKFTTEVAHSLLLSGRCQLLLDGFDEIDPSDIDGFLTKIEEFSDVYGKVQIVITSRNNEYLTGLHGYTRLYVWPFDEKQSIRLIDKILGYQNKMSEKAAVLDYINNGFLKKDGVFVSHPLLLTFVTMNYPLYKKFNENPLLFYKVTYEALLSGHDDNKKPYDRVFMSVDNAEQFSEVFSQFCAYTYRDGMLQLDTTDFDRYFSMLTAQQNFPNPHKMNVKNFKHDVCSTACIMYEKAYDLYYIDPGFQEFLFADYYAHAEKDEVQELQLALQNISYNKLMRFDALNMLHNFAEQKFKFYVLKPFLDSIFKGTDEEAFLLFLQNCFDTVDILCISHERVDEYRNQYNVEKAYFSQIENYSKTILLDYIFASLGISPEILYAMKTTPAVNKPKDVDIVGVALGQINKVEDKEILIIDVKPKDAFIYICRQCEQGEDCGFFTEEDGYPVQFGVRYRIDSFNMSLEPENYIDFVTNIMNNSPEIRIVFEQLKQLHLQLRKEHHRSGLK